MSSLFKRIKALPVVGLLCLVFFTPSSPAADGSPFDALSKFGNSLGLGKSEQVEFLSPDEAFLLTVEAIDSQTVSLRVDIQPGYYLYRDKFSFSLKQGQAELAVFELPAGITKEDPIFGQVQVFKHDNEFRLPLSNLIQARQEVLLNVGYQGCAEAGICYPPLHKDLPVFLDALIPAATAAEPTNQASAPSTKPASVKVSEQQSIVNLLADGKTLTILFAFLGFGLLLSLTPCVFPMIPILSGIIVGQGATITPRRGLTLSAVYVLAMALTYAVAGVLAGLFGQNLQATFQNPWILGSFSLVFVALALSMFGFFEISLPASLQTRLASISNHQKQGSYHGVFVMGLLSALIVGPCVAPPLAGTLIYIGQSGNAVLGGMALFIMGIGMGLPLLVIGASAGKWMPHAGVWMDKVKAVFGVLLLGVAIWLLERIIPASLSLFLWALLLIISAIFMGALDTLDAVSTGWQRLWKGVGLAIMVYGTVLVIGAAAGGSDVFQPLNGLRLAGSGSQPHKEQLEFKRIKGIAGLEKELHLASQQGKGVMLDFYADWCVECKKLEKDTFSNEAVRQQLDNIVLLQADVTANDDMDQALLKKLGLYGPPAILFYKSNAQENQDYRLIGFVGPDEFQSHLNGAYPGCANTSC